ncbi:hypothetical protein D5S17_22190 [Pseudonocardiaceae bacterium YIM PH 21723]|nr:hypothetical protein D5S17_22190 [Pseudonocardiaceae bacterium YIM PH 21723]
MVTLRGVAANAHAGAVLLRGEHQPVYIEGLDDWGDSTGSLLEVHGKLVEIEKPVPDVESHGIRGQLLVLRNARWSQLPTE